MITLTHKISLHKEMTILEAEQLYYALANYRDLGETTLEEMRRELKEALMLADCYVD